MYLDKSSIQKVRWLPVVNTDSEVAPAFAVLEVVGVTSSGVVQIRKSTRDDNNQVLINGPSEIAVSGYGSASTDYPLVAYCSTADGTPVNAEHWGAKAGSWKIHKGYEGFLIIGGENGERVTVARDPRCPATGAGSPYLYYYGPPAGISGGICGCEIIPLTYQLNSPTHADGTCSNCSVFGGLFELEYGFGSGSSGCCAHWGIIVPFSTTLECPPGAPCNAQFEYFLCIVSLVANGVALTLTNLGGGGPPCGYGAIWRNPNPWNCVGANIMQLDGTFTPPNCTPPSEVVVTAI